MNFAQTRWLLAGQKEHSIPIPFLVVLVCWLAIILGSFGLYARPNGTVIAHRRTRKCSRPARSP